MAILDLTDVIAIEFVVDTLVTLPDSADTFTALAGSRYGVSIFYGDDDMTVDVAGPFLCMTRSGRRTPDNVMPQVFTPDELRSAV